MTDHRSFLNKNLYKIFLVVVKFIPITLLIIKIISTILNLLSISLPILNFIGGTSIMFMLLLYLISFIFNYCYLYKMPLYFMTALDTFVVFGRNFISAIGMYRVIFIACGIFMVGFIIYAYTNRNNNKQDLIKELCNCYCKSN